jgi:nucleoside-diphosphate-sugar epimerase
MNRPPPVTTSRNAHGGHPSVHNTEGPRRGDVFVTSNFVKQVAEIEAGRHDPVIDVGDLTPRRDYSDVRDIVRGYWMLLERGEPGEVYNLCSGRTWTIQRVLDFYLDRSSTKGRSKSEPPWARLTPRWRPDVDFAVWLCFAKHDRVVLLPATDL